LFEFIKGGFEIGIIAKRHGIIPLAVVAGRNRKLLEIVVAHRHRSFDLYEG
jgi:hypothetical protein